MRNSSKFLQSLSFCPLDLSPISVQEGWDNPKEVICRLLEERATFTTLTWTGLNPLSILPSSPETTRSKTDSFASATLPRTQKLCPDIPAIPRVKTAPELDRIADYYREKSESLRDLDLLLQYSRMLACRVHRLCRGVSRYAE